MAKACFRAASLALTLAAGAAAFPLAAQMYSPGMQFLKDVKDRKGDEVTKEITNSNGAVVNARDISNGETALHVVTKRRDALWIRFLTERGANPNIADNKGVTPLQIAVSLGFTDGVEALLNAGADVDVTDSTGETPLIGAVLRRDIPLVRLLLAHGANADRSDNSGRTARDYATLDGNSRLLDEIRKSDEDRKGSKSGKTYGPTG